MRILINRKRMRYVVSRRRIRRCWKTRLICCSFRRVRCIASCAWRGLLLILLVVRIFLGRMWRRRLVIGVGSGWWRRSWRERTPRIDSKDHSDSCFLLIVRRKRCQCWEILAIIADDIAWVVATAILVAIFFDALSTAGLVIVDIVAAAVLFFAVLQIRAFRALLRQSNLAQST